MHGSSIAEIVERLGLHVFFFKSASIALISGTMQLAGKGDIAANQTHSVFLTKRTMNFVQLSTLPLDLPS